MSGDTLTSAIFLSEVGNHVQNLFLYFVGTRSFNYMEYG
jgi:hypothetical protein